MTPAQAACLLPGQTVVWTLTDHGPATVVDLHPRMPVPLGYQPRGRYVRIVWLDVEDKPIADVWTDDLLLAGPCPVGPPPPKPRIRQNPAC